MGKLRTIIGAHRRGVIIGGVVVALPLLALAWWLGSPLFLNRTVEEEFPLSANAAIPEGMTQQQVEDTMATLAMMDDAASEAMPEMMAESAPLPLKRGMFRDGDSFHKGSGGAAVYRLPDGSHVLRLDDFRVTNGPDLRVILAVHPDPQGRSDVHDAEYVELGKLKGNIGSQNYPIPDDVAIADYGSVVIYCKPFQVVFSVAPLTEEPAEYTKALVEEAIDRYERDGRQATIDYYNSAGSVDGEWYVFIIGPDGVTIAHHNQDFIGLDPSHRVDPTGYFFGDDLLGATEDGRWVDYVILNPETGQDKQKHTWVVRRDGLLFGSGWYEE